jgi:hypothetical protein
MNESLSNKIEINWYFEEGDDDMQELGYILKSLVVCPFDLIETKEKK